MGVLITMAEPTRGILDAIDHGGSYTWPVNGENFPRVQILTIAELLAGKRRKMPATFTPYIAPQRARAPVEQMSLTID